MRTMQPFKRALSSALAAAMLLSMSGMMPTVSAAGACTINTNKTYQSIRGFGGMNLPEWQGYDLTDAQIQTCFGNGAGGKSSRVPVVTRVRCKPYPKQHRMEIVCPTHISGWQSAFGRRASR